MISKFLSFWLVVVSPSRCISGCLGYFCWTAHRVRLGELLNGSWELLGLILVGLGGDFGACAVLGAFDRVAMEVRRMRGGLRPTTKPK